MSQTSEQEIEDKKKMHTEGVGDLTFKPEEEAAARYTYLLPVAKRLAGSMSAKGMARVVMALAEFPLQTTPKPRLIGKDENQLFQVIFELNVAKGMILDYAKKQSELTKTSAESTVVETETNVGS